LLDRGFYREYITRFRFEVPENLPGAKSVIVVAVPRPQNSVTLNSKGQQKKVIIPPIYAGFERIRMQVEKNIGEILAERGYSWARTNLPLKLLAVRTGLAKYGRNHLCYVKGMGSFLRLVAVYSDMPCTEDSWQELKMMETARNAIRVAKLVKAEQ
jgi:epoxyqueuosine reductase